MDINELREAIRKPYLTVFLDGRNEHGSHVLTMPGDNIGHYVGQIVEDLEDQDFGLAEQILKDAEALGYGEGYCVVTSWRFETNQCSPGFEYVGANRMLTEFLCGTPQEQDAEMDAMDDKLAALNTTEGAG